MKYWMPVDLYVGGAEHAVLHLLYARFWHKVLFDLGQVSSAEPFRRLYNQGYIQAYAYRDARGQTVPAEEVVETAAEIEPVIPATARTQRKKPTARHVTQQFVPTRATRNHDIHLGENRQEAPVSSTFEDTPQAAPQSVPNPTLAWSGWAAACWPILRPGTTSRRRRTASTCSSSRSPIRSSAAR